MRDSLRLTTTACPAPLCFNHMHSTPLFRCLRYHAGAGKQFSGLFAFPPVRVPFSYVWYKTNPHFFVGLLCMAPVEGLEPPTLRLTAECSTDWAKQAHSMLDYNNICGGILSSGFYGIVKIPRICKFLCRHRDNLGDVFFILMRKFARCTWSARKILRDVKHKTTLLCRFDHKRDIVMSQKYTIADIFNMLKR